MSLTREDRDRLPDEHFAVPGKRKLPIHDATHVRLAWDMVERTQGLSPAERTDARHRILHRAKELDVDTKGWHLTASFAIEAMAIEMPEVKDHPNRMPFSGVLTRIDKPSDNPVGGAKGKRVLISKSVAEAALPSLLGMAVDYKPDFDGHDNQAKIGIITEATVEGDAIKIAGFFYAHDFPKETARIKAEKGKLGFSYECQSRIQDLNADPWVVDACMFTGAAVLYKDRAAYTTTSLAAQAEDSFNMTPEELKKLLAESLAPVTTQINQLSTELADVKKKQGEALKAAGAVHELVKPHADKLRAAAASMEAAGVGMHAERGHVKVLRHMADHMEAEAIMNRLPHIYRDHDYIAASADKPNPETDKKLTDLQASLDKAAKDLEAAGTKIKDLEAKAFTNAAQPERKTFSPEVVTLLRKYDLAAQADEGKLTLDAVNKVLDAQPNMTTAQRIETKMKLQAAGVFAKAA